jgi:uncharacterized protein (UPF0332 family)
MPQVENHFAWCLKDERRLVKVRPNKELAEKHVKKSEYNYNVLLTLERAKQYDWALNVGSYAIYHCFLALLAKYGYSSRNQSCTITALLLLIEQKKLNIDKDIILQFDTGDVEEGLVNPTVRSERERSTYGVETSIGIEQLKRIKDFILKVQRETIKVLAE